MFALYNIMLIWTETAYIAPFMGRRKELLRSSEDSEDTDVTVDKFVMSMEVLGYNDIEPITVPQEVLDNAIETLRDEG